MYVIYCIGSIHLEILLFFEIKVRQYLKMNSAHQSY